ncbi:MAG: Rieske (2Fe-2S) protein [Thermoplasmata archaeon]|nr:Rieske (2Fe-2S) protein [Thermoplasmata archaeon]
MVETFRLEKSPLPAEGQGVRVIANGVPVAVFRVGGTLYAIDARCTHVGGPLDQGTLKGNDVTCPLHGSVFDVRNGKVVRGPATRPETAYRVRLEGETLILERD